MPDIMHSGDICLMKFRVSMPDCEYMKRFWGLPKGISRDPRIAAIFSIEITGSIYFSLSPPLKSSMVRGTNMIRDTSLVTNMDVKNTPKIRNRERVSMVEKRALSMIRGLKIFSCLKPSSTQSIMSSVPRVLQSTADKSAGEGGVIKSDITAASSDTVSIASFFRNSTMPEAFIYLKLSVDTSFPSRQMRSRS